MKPNVVFFGESISEEVKNRAFKAVEASSQLLILGTSLATYSAFRYVPRLLSSFLNAISSDAQTFAEILLFV